MVNYRPKHRVKVDGAMTPEGADQAGNKLATAAMIGATLFGLASIIAAIGFLLEKLI